MMKKILFLAIGLILSQLAMAQTIVVLDLPNPCSGAGMEETVTKDFDFGVFPNPADDAVTLSFSSTDPIGKVEVEVCDLRGVSVIREQYYSVYTELRTELNLDKLAPGIYTISVRGKETYAVKKLIIE